eukprot:m.335526 g.335526  ORF g.335526 m.335526 type:complete len:102 (+) comp17620_c0_seq1:129-434(+)
MPDYVGFVESDGHRNIVRADTVTIMRKKIDGTYNLHIQGYSQGKITDELQVFQSLEEAYAWMDLLTGTPLPGGTPYSNRYPRDEDTTAAESPSSSSTMNHE